MTKVIKVDFLNKCREGEYEYSRYLCHVCDNRYEYDSRTDKPEDKMPYVKVQLPKLGKTVNICKCCANTLHSLF
ncbi:MAG: hypothetical protein GOVbin4162_107 [Prokaryotic dsDNA virus sp.]|nr:MAG: hypothetical protein GOVbin4162_107 [Prokaryotic dsDNA virus sp.]